MPKVVLIIDDVGRDRARLLGALRKHLRLRPAELIAAVETREAYFEKPLFNREDPSFPARLFLLLSELDQLDVAYGAYQILDGQSFDKNQRSAYYAVTTARLGKIIQARGQCLEEQRKTARLEAGLE